MQMERIEVLTLEALHNLGPPQIRALCLWAEERARSFADGLLVGYGELLGLLDWIEPSRQNRQARKNIHVAMARLFDLREIMVQASRFDFDEHGTYRNGPDDLAERVAIIVRETTRDHLELDGNASRELESAKLQPFLELIRQLYGESEQEEQNEEESGVDQCGIIAEG